MHDEAIDRLWRSAGNEPSPETRAALIGEARATLGRRRVQLTALLVFAGVVLCLPLAMMGLSLLTGGGVDLRGEWALAPLTLIPLILLLVIAMRRPGVSGEATLQGAFRALAADNAAARVRTLVIGAAMAIFAPFLFAALNQLADAGKMAPGETASAAVVLFGALALSACWIVANYVLRLRPDAQRLASLIRQYEQSP